MVPYSIPLLNGLNNIRFWNWEEVNECTNSATAYTSINIRPMEIRVTSRYGNIQYCITILKTHEKYIWLWCVIF